MLFTNKKHQLNLNCLTSIFDRSKFDWYVIVRFGISICTVLQHTQSFYCKLFWIFHILISLKGSPKVKFTVKSFLQFFVVFTFFSHSNCPVIILIVIQVMDVLLIRNQNALYSKTRIYPWGYQFLKAFCD